jgi:ArsR family transcriptional regulator, arsenate/arsenite/antimonite-responsive transcriptional repressor
MTEWRPFRLLMIHGRTVIGPELWRPPSTRVSQQPEPARCGSNGCGGRTFDNPQTVVDAAATFRYFDEHRMDNGVKQDEVVAALAALAHEHRLKAYRLLVETGPDGLSAGVVAERLGIPPSSLTFHLQHLLRAGLVSQRRVSRQLIYAMIPTAMNNLVGFLTENCCGREAACGTACNPAVANVAVPTKTARSGRKK